MVAFVSVVVVVAVVVVVVVVAGASAAFNVLFFVVFIRCHDLLEINKTMLEFARYEEGKKMEITLFQGQFGKEIEK